MNTYCLRHTPVTIALGLGMLFVGTGGVCHGLLKLGGNLPGAMGIFLVLGSLLVAVWPNEPRLHIYTDSFVVSGFLRGSSRVYPWETLLSVETDESSSRTAFVVVTAKGRVRIPTNMAGLSEVRRLFEMVAQAPENAQAILTHDYCEEEDLLELRKTWQMSIAPALMIPVGVWLLIQISSDTWWKTLFAYLFFGLGLAGAVSYTYQSLRTPYSIRLKGTTLSVVGPIGKRTWDLAEISAMDLTRGVDSERVRIRTSDGKTSDVRLKDFFGYPVFDRAFYSILCRWQKTRAADTAE